MKKIWEWAYREIYQIDNDICIKKIKPYRVKTYFWCKIKFTTKIYTLLKFWALNINKIDLENYYKIKKLFPNNIPEINYLDKNGNLVQSIIKDYNWKKTITLLDFTDKIDYSIWMEFKNMVVMLLKYWIEIMDIRESNIFVQEYERWKYRLILSDFKRIWWRTYPFQFYLAFKVNRDKKTLRRLDRLEKILIQKWKLKI